MSPANSSPANGGREPVGQCELCMTPEGQNLDLRVERVIRQGGYEATCNEINSIVRSSSKDSKLCTDSKSQMASKCCYEQCSLCEGDPSNIEWYATVQFQGLTTTCLGMFFSMLMWLFLSLILTTQANKFALYENIQVLITCYEVSRYLKGVIGAVNCKINMLVAVVLRLCQGTRVSSAWLMTSFMRSMTLTRLLMYNHRNYPNQALQPALQ